MSSDVDARLQLQSQRVDNLTESVHKVQKDTVNNAETLQALLISMENLGENFKELRDDMLAANIAEQQMEIEGDEEHDKLNAELLKEVSLPLTAVQEPISFVPASLSSLMSIPQAAVNPEFNQPSFAFSPAVDADIQARFSKLRAGPQTTPEISVGIRFWTKFFWARKGVIKII